MGDHKVNKAEGKRARTAFIGHLLDDIKALEIMLEKGLFEKDVERIGAEQEFCLITENWRPSKSSEDILQAINDPHFTTELAQYNLEINLDPVELKGNCFSLIHQQLIDLLNKAQSAAVAKNAKVLLSGILPTVSKNELNADYMTPNPRYWALNDMIREMRGADFELHIKGIDELSIKHDSVLFEACNTSFQLHLQVAPEDFISSYNWAQTIAGPVLSICTNAPLLLGRELWSETRIALFQQSIDTRSSSFALKTKEPRVTFGSSWAEGSVAEIFKHDIARYQVILASDIKENSLEVLKSGKTPRLKALCLHNGTVYRWNRPCYGVGGEKAHLRIENRYIPSGPSTVDEMANFVFWVGLMKGRPSKYDDMKQLMDFGDVKANFIKAARTGKESVFKWMGGTYTASELALKELLPIAYDGLSKTEISREDVDHYMGIIEKRIAGITGSQWIVANYRKLKKHMRQDKALQELTKAIYQYQQDKLPIHAWPMLTAKSSSRNSEKLFVNHVMSTELFTVNEHDLADLAISIMRWKNIHHVPVEGSEGKLKGLLTWNGMKKYMGSVRSISKSVSDIMEKNIISVEPGTKLDEAIKLMKQNDIGCLPVVQNNRLVGIMTKKDIINLRSE
ncbi:CBS domain-containing protein [Fulvivirgaceae bacterium BMA10]|uniref:CBS domain-containing protein n=1 Tax=Splendidivirga corallicola TaxID=3051826 RepID=A0ABT8KKQ8_9BACT|nr:CBS domain-containing protein [Fulvivirgaceae bacterium BMA10]